jgi:hypothetical protein
MDANRIQNNMLHYQIKEQTFKWDKARKQQCGRPKVWKRKKNKINIIVFVSCKVK